MNGLTIAVFMGGPSAEREISLQSGRAVQAALERLGHRVEALDPVRADWTLPGGTDVVFLALHGEYGEDGGVQERLEQLGVPYTGSGVDASRTGFDKVLSKERFVELGIPTPRYFVAEDERARPQGALDFPLVLKPARQGSSVGLQFVDDEEGWEKALRESLRFDRRVLVEEKISGRETTVGFLGDLTLPVVEVRPKKGAYDFQNKYTSGATDYFCPADFESEVTARIQAAGLGAFEAIGCRDYGRVDVMVREDGAPFVLEVNTLPGMTETSLLPKAAAAVGISYEDLCQRMIDLAMGRPAAKR